MPVYGTAVSFAVMEDVEAAFRCFVKKLLPQACNVIKDTLMQI